jgi:ribonuclease P protein component, eubacterial
MRFRPEQHVRRQSDFRDAREKGRRLDCGGFTLWYYRRPADVSAAAPGARGGDVVPAPVTGPRLGVIASTAAVGGAVLRNRAKRRLREVFRLHQRCVPADYDVLLVARRSLNRLPYAAIERAFVETCRRIFPEHS